MHTAYPATRPTVTFLELADHSADMCIARLLILHIRHPANPLVAGERCEAIPQTECRAIGSERLS